MATSEHAGNPAQALLEQITLLFLELGVPFSSDDIAGAVQVVRQGLAFRQALLSLPKDDREVGELMDRYGPADIIAGIAFKLCENADDEVVDVGLTLGEILKRVARLDWRDEQARRELRLSRWRHKGKKS